MIRRPPRSTRTDTLFPYPTLFRSEAEWAALRAADAPRARVFYRRRLRNVARKSGNIKDFLERWGSRYEYMIVFDADSVMSGETMVELVRRMDEAPGVGLIQVPPQPTRGETLFARLQEFASSVHGPMRSDERRVGTEGVSTCRSRVSPYY